MLHTQHLLRYQSAFTHAKHSHINISLVSKSLGAKLRTGMLLLANRERKKWGSPIKTFDGSNRFLPIIPFRGRGTFLKQ